MARLRRTYNPNVIDILDEARKQTLKAAKRAKKGDKKQREITYAVGSSRARWKVNNMSPTQFQAQLLDYVLKCKAVPFRDTIGFNWTMLGGLLARGRVVWVTQSDGELVLKPRG